MTNAHHKLVYNIGNMFDSGACSYKKMATATSDSLLRLEELVGRMAIREATAEIVSRGCLHSDFRYGDPLLWWPFAIADPNRVIFRY